MKISKMIYSLCAVGSVFCLNAHAEGERTRDSRWDTNALSSQRVMMSTEARPSFSYGAPDFQVNHPAAGQGFSGQYGGGQDLEPVLSTPTPEVWPPFAAYNGGQYVDSRPDLWHSGAVYSYPVGYQDFTTGQYAPEVWPPFDVYNNGQYADSTGSSRWELGAVPTYQGGYQDVYVPYRLADFELYDQVGASGLSGYADPAPQGSYLPADVID